MESYLEYLRRLYMLGQMEILLISMQHEVIFQMNMHGQSEHFIEKKQKARQQVIDLLFKRKANEYLQDRAFVATKQELTFCTTEVILAEEQYFLIIGPFYLKNDRKIVMEKGIRQFTMQELDGFLPLFTKQMAALTISDMDVETKNGSPQYGAEEVICYNDDTVISINAGLEEAMLNAVSQGDIVLLEELQKKFFSNPEHYEVGSGLRKEKNITLTTNTLASRAAISGGASLLYIRGLCAVNATKIERMKSEIELTQFRREISLEYCKKVRESRLLQYSIVMRKCISYMETHLSEELRMDQLALYCNVSYEHLSRSIKKECGMSFSKLLNTMRIERAKSYLRMQIPIVETAEKCGFKTESHFCRVFREQTGVTATKWLEQHYRG